MIWARDTGDMEEDLDEFVFRRLEKQDNLRMLIDLHLELFTNGAEPSRCWLPTGWFGLLDRLCTAIGQKLVTSGEPSVRVTGVREKFGLLKFGVEPVGFGRAIAQLVAHANIRVFLYMRVLRGPWPPAGPANHCCALRHLPGRTGQALRIRTGKVEKPVQVKRTPGTRTRLKELSKQVNELLAEQVEFRFLGKL